jgi:dephospho-CoA kinase
MIVGVLGGVGAGKSTVVRMLVELGAEAIDADQVAHEVLETIPVRKTLSEWFGPGVFRPDGTVDRGAVAARVFRDGEALRRLEGLVHPRVREVMGEKVAAFRRSRSRRELLVLDVPLLAESPLLGECDALLFVEAGSEARRQRVHARGWSPEELQRREKFQMDLDAKKRLADRIIDNSGSLEATRSQVRAYHESLQRARAEEEPGRDAGGGRRMVEEDNA